MFKEEKFKFSSSSLFIFYRSVEVRVHRKTKRAHEIIVQNLNLPMSEQRVDCLCTMSSRKIIQWCLSWLYSYCFSWNYTTALLLTVFTLCLEKQWRNCFWIDCLTLCLMATATPSHLVLIVFILCLVEQWVDGFHTVSHWHNRNHLIQKVVAWRHYEKVLRITLDTQDDSITPFWFTE